MKNRGKNKSVTFIILFSVYIYIYIVTYVGRNSTGSTRHQKGGGAANDSATL